MAAPVESSRFWTTGGAGDGAATYTRDQLAESFRAAFLKDNTTQGVFNGLAVSGAASPLTLATGAACVYGFFHFCTTAGDLTVATPAVGTTGGHVVLRADWTAQTVRAVAVRNTDGNSATPSLTQTAGTTWEIRIATFSITTGGVITVTDARQFCSGPGKLTATRIPYATTGGQLTDDANLSWDSTNHRLTINSGYAVPLRGRQGGSATDWSSPGTTNQTLTTPRMQIGVVSVTTDGSGNASATITFPVAFSQPPVVFVTPHLAFAVAIPRCEADSATTTQVVLQLAGGAATTGYRIAWLAIGLE